MISKAKTINILHPNNFGVNHILRKLIILFWIVWGVFGVNHLPVHAAGLTDLVLKCGIYELKTNQAGEYEIQSGAFIRVDFQLPEGFIPGSIIRMGDNQGDIKYSETRLSYFADIRVPVSSSDLLDLIYDDTRELSKIGVIRILPSSVVIDPAGQYAFDVRVILFIKDEEGLKQVWQDPEQLQRNPQYTDHTGQYSFYVP
ncbi:MAG TPA: hypothetical protein ENN77_02035, partial [Candidatus Wirthbacteria bacterium]|nr:hypothetical protein [Candidatus Wirthbacteria bacterium]